MKYCTVHTYIFLIRDIGFTTVTYGMITRKLRHISLGHMTFISEYFYDKRDNSSVSAKLKMVYNLPIIIAFQH